MSSSFDNFTLESPSSVIFHLNSLCAEKLNKFNNISIDEKKEYFKTCEYKMKDLLGSFSNTKQNLTSKNF